MSAPHIGQIVLYHARSDEGRGGAEAITAVLSAYGVAIGGRPVIRLAKRPARAHIGRSNSTVE